MAKRKNGEGTWGTKTIKGNTYKFYRNPEGKYFYGKTEKEINEKRKKYNPLKETNKDVKKEYFGDYILNWLLNVKGTEIKRHTLDGYEDCIKGQIINYTDYNLSDIQVGALTTEHLIKYYVSLANNYARSSIKKNYAIVAQCIKYGNKNEHFSSIIDFDEVKIPHEDNIKNKKKEIQFLTQDDMNKLYEESKRINVPGFTFGGKIGESTYGNNANLLMFIMFTGLRIGEAMDLKWKDLDLSSKNPKVHVTSNAVKLKDREGKSRNKYIDASSSTKTYSGNRIVPLNKQALEIIETEKRINPSYKDDDYVFITKNGDKISLRRNVNRTLTKMVTRAGCSIPDCSPHELRHSFGSALIRNGVDIKVVSQLLGHKDISVTYNIYIHILEEQKIDAINSLDNIING
nr:site-specific integrase [uncultured Lachnoclostridium sp.]